MESRLNRVVIISELHPQHYGDMKTVETMILQSKMGGADMVKVQLYTSKKLFGDDRKKYAEISFDELQHIKSFSENVGIDVFASVFDNDKIVWCEKLGFKNYKIASRSMYDNKLCNAIIDTKKTVFISTGLDHFSFPYNQPNVIYFYCNSNYPDLMENIMVPDFRHSKYQGYSDHSIGLTSAFVAVVRGARYIEKHFTISHALQSSHEKAHVGAMNFEELLALRRFCDEFASIDDLEKGNFI